MLSSTCRESRWLKWVFIRMTGFLFSVRESVRLFSCVLCYVFNDILCWTDETVNFSCCESNIFCSDYLVYCNTVLPLVLSFDWCILLCIFQAAGKCFLMSAPTANSHSWFSVKKEVPGQQEVAHTTHLYSRTTPHHAGPPADVSTFV